MLKYWFVKVVAGLFWCMLGANVAQADETTIANVKPSLERMNTLYSKVLLNVVSQGEKNDLQAAMVDYQAVRSDERVDELMLMLADFPESELKTHEQKLAFYLNAYNIMAVNMVAVNWPIKSLKSMGNMFRPVWTHKCGELHGKHMTLRILEHEILRKMGEPRIHFALNCASMSCPDLRAEPYVAERIHEQLADQSRHFLLQAGKGIEIKNNEVYVSSIFKWFDEDFDTEGGVIPFINAYASEVGLALPDNWDIKGYLAYDWSVNDELTGSELQKYKGKTWF